MNVWIVVRTVYDCCRLSTIVEIIGVFKDERKARAKQEEESNKPDTEIYKLVDVYVESFEVE